MMESWLGSKNIASRATLLARLSTLFKFCVRRGYLASNPCARLIQFAFRPPARTERCAGEPRAVEVVLWDVEPFPEPRFQSNAPQAWLVPV